MASFRSAREHPGGVFFVRLPEAAPTVVAVLDAPKVQNSLEKVIVTLYFQAIF